MDSQQMMEFLLAIMAKLDARTEPTKARTEAINARTAAMREKRLKAHINASQEMDVDPEERKPTSVEMKPEGAKQREVPIEDA